MKRLITVIILLQLGSIYICSAKEERVITTYRNNSELISVYIDGKDVTGDYSLALEKASMSVKKYLCLSAQEMKKVVDCILGDDRITMELIYDGIKYTFCCNFNGDILSVNTEETYSLNE